MLSLSIPSITPTSAEDSPIRWHRDAREWNSPVSVENSRMGNEMKNKQAISKIKNGDSWDGQESVKLNWRSIPITVRRLLATCFGLTASSVDLDTDLRLWLSWSLDSSPLISLTAQYNVPHTMWLLKSNPHARMITNTASNSHVGVTFTFRTHQILEPRTHTHTLFKFRTMYDVETDFLCW